MYVNNEGSCINCSGGCSKCILDDENGNEKCLKCDLAKAKEKF